MKNTLNYTILAGLFIIPFLAFFVPEAMFFPFISGKGFAFRILVEIMFGAYVILAFLDPNYRPKLSWITKAVLVFGVAILVADLLGVNPYKSIWSNYERMEGFVLIFHLVLYYVVASSFIKTRELWNKLINTSIFASFLMAIFGLFQIFGLATINQGGVRVDGTMGNAAYLAIYLVFHIFLSIYMFLSAKENWQKWTYGGVALLEMIILYFTATRGAILGLVGGLLIAGILIAWKERENKTIRKISTWTVGSILVLILLFTAIKGTSFVQSSPVLSRFSTLSYEEFKTQGRYFVWPMAIKGFMERPVFGWGQEGFNFVFNKYYDPRMYGQEQWFDRTHNVILDWLVAGGLVGLLAYLSIFAALMYYVWRRNSRLSFAERSVFTGMIIAYFFHNLFVFDNLISYIVFFSLLAYIHSLSSAGESQVPTNQKTFKETTVNYITAPIVIILTIVGIYVINVPALKANLTLIEALKPQPEGVTKNIELFEDVYSYNSFGSTEATEQLVQVASQIQGANTSNDIKQKFYTLAESKVVEKVNETPNDARYLVFAGSFFNRFSQYDRAIPYLERAIEASPKKQTIYFELGTSYLGKGNTQKMFEVFKEAYELEPNAPESKIIYAVGAIYTNNTQVLNQISSEIDEELIITDNRFLNAYATVGNYNMVISILKTRIERDPTNPQYKLSLASTYVNIGQKQQAIDIIQGMINENPEFKAEGEEYIRQIQNS